MARHGQQPRASAQRADASRDANGHTRQDADRPSDVANERPTAGQTASRAAEQPAVRRAYGAHCALRKDEDVAADPEQEAYDRAYLAERASSNAVGAGCGQLGRVHAEDGQHGVVGIHRIRLAAAATIVLAGSTSTTVIPAACRARVRPMP